MLKEEKDLRNRTKAFALRIVRIFSALPKTTEAQVLGKQLLRSGTSIGANYREAFRARSKAEFIAKCGDSLREIEESAYWLELLVEAGVVSVEKLAPLRQECEELTAIFVTIVKRAKTSQFFLHPSSFASSLNLVHQRIQEERQEARHGSVTDCRANGRAFQGCVR